jgi:hypothetical protein
MVVPCTLELRQKRAISYSQDEREQWRLDKFREKYGCSAKTATAQGALVATARIGSALSLMNAEKTAIRYSQDEREQW